jgi:hypothetical protein
LDFLGLGPGGAMFFQQEKLASRGRGNFRASARKLSVTTPQEGPVMKSPTPAPITFQETYLARYMGDQCRFDSA